MSNEYFRLYTVLPGDVENYLSEVSEDSIEGLVEYLDGKYSFTFKNTKKSKSQQIALFLHKTFLLYKVQVETETVAFVLCKKFSIHKEIKTMVSHHAGHTGGLDAFIYNLYNNGVDPYLITVH